MLIFVPAPHHATRMQILKIHCTNMPLSQDVDLDHVASQTGGYSGAALEAVVREAGLVSLRCDIDSKNVTREGFAAALEWIKPSVTYDMKNWYEGFGKWF